MRLRHRVTFKRQSQDSDGYGNVSGEFEPLFTVWGNVRETPGKERVEAGSVEGIVTCTIRIRDSAQARTITAADQAEARGKVWNLEAPTFVSDRGTFIDIKGTSGGAQ